MAASLQWQKVLIVEDEPFIALDVETILSTAGAMVISVHHVQEAFEAAQNGDFTAAVLDVHLGDQDCGVLCEVLAQRKVPFIFHTGYAGGGPIDVWPRPIVEKPTTPDKLLSCLAAALFNATR